MLTDLLIVAISFTVLVWSADRFIDGAAAIARSFGMSPLLIGMTIVSVGTSAPEILVSLMSALAGAGSLAGGQCLGVKHCQYRSRVRHYAAYFTHCSRKNNGLFRSSSIIGNHCIVRRASPRRRTVGSRCHSITVRFNPLSTPHGTSRTASRSIGPAP